jgi:hypothetical protein
MCELRIIPQKLSGFNPDEFSLENIQSLSCQKTFLRGTSLLAVSREAKGDLSHFSRETHTKGLHRAWALGDILHLSRTLAATANETLCHAGGNDE